MFETLLFPYDGSELAASALPQLTSIAHAFHSRVIVVAAADPVALTVQPEAGAPVLGVVSDERLSSLRAALADQGITEVTALLVHGPPAEAILAVARENGVDLVVMATRGRGGIERTVGGSVSDAVVQGARGFSVLLVRPDDAGG